MISFAKRFLIIVTIVVAIVDLAEFYAIEKSPTILTLSFASLAIIATIAAIAINLWYWLPKYKLKW
jgi:riboflavin transporter FmnP